LSFSAGESKHGKIGTARREVIIYIFDFPRKTGAGEGIRTLDPNLGKIQLYEFIVLNQVPIRTLKNPNTIRTFRNLTVLTP
jgi:hypothetical protein